MEEEFYKGRLSQKFGLAVSIPDAPERAMIHRVIYDELVVGKIEERSKAQFIDVIEQMAAQGAQGVILGCTEIGLLVHEADCNIPLFDTTRIHAEAAVAYALENDGN